MYQLRLPVAQIFKQDHMKTLFLNKWTFLLNNGNDAIVDGQGNG